MEGTDNIMDTPQVDDSIFEEPTEETVDTPEETEDDIFEEPSQEEDSYDADEDIEEAEEEAEEAEPRKFANKYNSEGELVKGYSNLLNVYKKKVSQLAESTQDESYLELLKELPTEFDTVDDLEKAYKEINNDYQRQARTLNVLKGKKQQSQAPANQQPVNQYNSPQQQGVIPPELAANPNFMSLMQTNPLQAVDHIVQYRVQAAVRQREQAYQQQMQHQARENALMQQVGEIKQKPDFEDLRDDIIETLEEIPSLAQQQNGLAQAYEYAKLKKMRRELSENAVTAQQIKINNQEQKRRAQAPSSGSSKGSPSTTPEEQIVNEMFAQNKGLSEFLR